MTSTGTSEMTKSAIKASDKPPVSQSASSGRDSTRSSHLQMKSAVRKQPNNSIKDLKDLDLAVKSSQSHDDRLEKIWVKLFGAAAALDILTTILPHIFRVKEAREMALAIEEAESKRKLPTFLTFWKKHPSSILDLTAEQCVDGFKCMYERSIHWMEDHRIRIGWIFCVCWTIDSAHKAYLAWISASEPKKTSSPEAKSRDNTKLKEACSSLMAPSNLAFTKTLLFRLSLLPIGFFMLRLVDHLSILKLNERSSMDQSQADPLTGTSSAHHIGDFSSSETERYCVLVVILLQFKALSLLFLKHQIASLKKMFAKKIAPRIFRFAVLKPRLFKNRIASLLVLLRWVKYLIPLIQKSEKIIKTFIKIIKIRKQRYQAAKAHKLRRKLFCNYSPEKKAEVAAIRLQRRFRLKKAMKESELKRILLKKRERKMVAAIHSVLLARAVKAKVEVQRKKNELLDLTEKSSSGDRDRLRLEELQLELGNISKEKQLQNMLLRPDSKFLIGWKVMFMICIAIEMAHKAFPPKLAENMDEAMSLQLNLEGVFIPERIEDWASCRNHSGESKRFSGLFDATTANDTFDSSEMPW
eukprot:CAMPEP_0198273596 /NCGR_PEP_ID=MMETSP1447-20131203/57363_1 /TAXON_ID=420782 /ORGANISM="Chaetoceros dichaeta, Strain CCMP1751" /LENGTH=582 /DNA_ID=CAMNT_0043967347 /DNA_START=1 /DNA_END=1746 /DNA_ORIENTATION=-